MAIDNGFSKHMTCDKDKFVKLKKEKEGSMTFGNINSSKILGKGTTNLLSEAAQVEIVLLVKNRRHNLLSISQICDQGHTLAFNSKYRKIKRKGSGRLVATTIRTLNNIYVLDIAIEENCFMVKLDEIWLWH